MVRFLPLLLLGLGGLASCDRLLPLGLRADATSDRAGGDRGLEARPGDLPRPDLGPLPPPRQIWPLTGSTVTEPGWPSFKYAAAGGYEVLGEISVTPDWKVVLAKFGPAGHDAVALPTNTPLFWRLRSRQGNSVGEAGPTWWFKIAKRAPSTVPGPVTAWGNPADLDGDGRAEILIGAKGSQQVFVCRAGPGVVSCDPPRTAPAPQVSAVSSFGASVSTTDLDGDGLSDLIVGDPNGGSSYAGTVFVFPSRAPGPQVLANGTPGSRFGWAVAGAGDVDGDGYGDLVVTAMGTGGVYFFRGGAQKVTLAAAIDSPGVAMFGWSAAAAGDVDGDRYPDVIIGAQRASTAFIFRGGPGGLDQDRKIVLSAPGGELGFGFSVAGAGDVNGDGFADVLVGVHDVTVSQDGLAIVYHGAPSGIVPKPNNLTGQPEIGEGFGHTVAGAGDMNGDGFDDVLVGRRVDGLTGPGRVYRFLGSAGGVLQSSRRELATLEKSFGGVAGLGDVDGDGLADGAAVAASDSVPSGGTGRVYLVSKDILALAIDAPAGALSFGAGIGSTY